MVVSIICKATNSSQFTIETVVCFDYCLTCGAFRWKDQSKQVHTNKGIKYVHMVSCCCGDVHHETMDNDFMIIRMLNWLSIDPKQDLTP
jgi:hypothetical protein